MERALQEHSRRTSESSCRGVIYSVYSFTSLLFKGGGALVQSAAVGLNVQERAEKSG